MDDAPSEALDLVEDSGMDPAARPLFARLAELATAIEAERRRYAATTKPLIEERNRLWQELTARGFSRRDLAKVTKVTPMTVQAVVKGRTSQQRRRQGKDKAKGRAGSPINAKRLAAGGATAATEAGRGIDAAPSEPSDPTQPL